VFAGQARLRERAVSATGCRISSYELITDAASPRSVARVKGHPPQM